MASACRTERFQRSASMVRIDKGLLPVDFEYRNIAE